jgi:hypothetical protein
MAVGSEDDVRVAGFPNVRGARRVPWDRRSNPVSLGESESPERLSFPALDMVGG